MINIIVLFRQHIKYLIDLLFVYGYGSLIILIIWKSMESETPLHPQQLFNLLMSTHSEGM